VSFLTRFYSAFPGGTMQQTLGGGTISEAAGVLTVAVAQTVDGDWAPNLAPIAWVPAHSQQVAFDTVFKCESRLYSHTTVGGNIARSGIVLYKDYDNGLEFGHYSGDNQIYVTRWMSGSGGNVANTSPLATPTASPHTYRVYWNPTNRPLFVQEEGISFTINANSMQFWYRVGDAGTWTLLHTRDWEWKKEEMLFGCCAHNYQAQKHGVTALFSQAGIYQWDATAQIFVPANDQVPLTNTSVDPKEVLALEDQAQALTQSGPAGHQWPDGQGDGFIQKDLSVAAFEDQAQILTQSGQPTHSMRDGLDQGYAFRPPTLALEDQVSVFLSGEPEFSTSTNDSDGHAHFNNLKPYLLIAGDTTGEPWDTPTLNSFTGYGRDGYKYTNGIQDAGPVSAPWRSEASSANRSSRPDFPHKYLIAVSRLELTIFDLDSYVGTPTSLRMWMRFLLGNSVSDFYALGRGVETIRSAIMANGQLVVGTTNTGWENGRLHSVDFRATTPATVFSLIGSDNQWVGQGTKSVVDRNTNAIWAVSGSNRINTEENHSLAHYVEGTNTLYVFLAGEDASPQIVKYTGGTIQSVVSAAGESIGSDNAGDYRRVLIDENGWLWFAIGSRLYRNVFDWQEGYMYPSASDLRQGSVDLGYTITHLAQVGNDIYAGTSKGVFRIGKGSLESYLAYTVAGEGGGGRLNAPPAGEIIPGTTAKIQSLQGLQFSFSGLVIKYLVVGTIIDRTLGSACIIRLFDDVLVKSLIYPDLIEQGVLSAQAIGA